VYRSLEPDAKPKTPNSRTTNKPAERR